MKANSILLDQMESYGYGEDLMNRLKCASVCTVKHGVGFFMVWGCTSKFQKTLFIDDTMNRNMYVSILKQI